MGKNVLEMTERRCTRYRTPRKGRYTVCWWRWIGDLGLWISADVSFETSRKPRARRGSGSRLTSSVASPSRWLLVGSRRTAQQGRRLLRPSAGTVADQQDGDNVRLEAVPIAVGAVVAAAASQVNSQSGVQQQPMIL